MDVHYSGRVNVYIFFSYFYITDSRNKSQYILTTCSIIGIYTTFVLVVSRFLKGFLGGQTRKIMYEDLPNVDRVLQLCLDIYLVSLIVVTWHLSPAQSPKENSYLICIRIFYYIQNIVRHEDVESYTQRI